MKLAAYLEKHGISQEIFGKSLSSPVSQGMVSQWLRGETAITLERVKQIVLATGGEVTPYDLMPDTFPRGFEFQRQPKRARAPHPRIAAALPSETS